MFGFLFLVPLGIAVIISAYNFITAPEIKPTYNNFEVDAEISVLIPARNEAKNIQECLESVLDQDIKINEVIVLDDQSTDNTAGIVEAMLPEFKNLKLIKGGVLPSGWLGKNFACHQLYKASGGNLLLFIDADVKLKRKAVSLAAKQRIANNAKMLTVFPTQVIKSFGELLTVPLMNWLLLSFLPLKKVLTSDRKEFVAANGQFMFWDRKTYEDSGGHAAVRNKLVEDMELARSVKHKKVKIITLLGGDYIFCRMYGGIIEAFNGFTKNFYAGFNTSPIVFILLLLALTLVFLSPVIMTASAAVYIASFMIIANRILVSLKSRQQVVLNLSLHPFQIIIMFILGVRSLIKTRTRKVLWKDRKY